MTLKCLVSDTFASVTLLVVLELAGLIKCNFFTRVIVCMVTFLFILQGSPTGTVSTSTNFTCTNISAIGIKFVLVEIGYVVPTNTNFA